MTQTNPKKGTKTSCQHWFLWQPAFIEYKKVNKKSGLGTNSKGYKIVKLQETFHNQIETATKWLSDLGGWQFGSYQLQNALGKIMIPCKKKQRSYKLHGLRPKATIKCIAR